jgi:hypothetical protein
VRVARAPRGGLFTEAHHIEHWIDGGEPSSPTSCACAVITTVSSTNTATRWSSTAISHRSSRRLMEGALSRCRPPPRPACATTRRSRQEPMTAAGMAYRCSTISSSPGCIERPGVVSGNRPSGDLARQARHGRGRVRRAGDDRGGSQGTSTTMALVTTPLWVVSIFTGCLETGRTRRWTAKRGAPRPQPGTIGARAMWWKI